MNNISKTLLAGAVAATAFAASAQASLSGYFLEGYNFRHQLNAAFAPENNFIAISPLGNTNLGLESNVGLSTFLYKLPDGRLTTFMNSSVGDNEFLDKLSQTNKVNLLLNTNILSFGFRGLGGYNTVGMMVRANGAVTMPKDLFAFMKLGQTTANTRYDFKDIRVRANAYGELALGHQHNITPNLSIGAKAKVLVGLADVDAHVNRMDVTLGQEKWAVNAQGDLNIAGGPNLTVPSNRESGKELENPKKANEIDFKGIKYNGFGIGGLGFAVDLGAAYKLESSLGDLTVSAAINDLGFIKWKNNHRATTSDMTWSFDGFKDVAISSDQPGYEENKLDKQIDNLVDDLEECINFNLVDGTTDRKEMLAATMHVGAEYALPFYKGLTAGLLLSQRAGGAFGWTEGRLFANLKPCSWFDCSVNYGMGTLGESLGWMVNFHPRGITFFVGSDHQVLKVNPIGIPINHANANLTFGFNINFGAKAKR